MVLSAPNDGYDRTSTLFHAIGWWMSTYMPPSLDKEPSDCDTRLCFTKRAHAAIAESGAVAAVTKAASASFSFSFLSSSFSSSSSSVSQRGVVVTTYRKNWSDSRLAATRVALRNILWGGRPLRNTRIFERETFHSKYFKLRKPNKYFCLRSLKSEFYDPNGTTLFSLNLWPLLPLSYFLMTVSSDQTSVTNFQRYSGDGS